MSYGELGRVCDDGEVITREGDKGSCMYVILSGTAEVTRQGASGPITMGTLGSGDIFGEMALFSGEQRTATVRVVGGARILTIDKKAFLRRVHEDPSLAFRMLAKLSERIAALDDEVVKLRSERAPAG